MLQVKEFVESMGLDRKEVIQALREEFPGFDKTLLSKVENPDKYGVRLLNRWEQILEENFSNTAPAVRKVEKWKRPSRIQFRLTVKEFEALQRAFRQAGFETMQQGMAALVAAWLDGRNESVQ